MGLEGYFHQKAISLVLCFSSVTEIVAPLQRFISIILQFMLIKRYGRVYKTHPAAALKGEFGTKTSQRFKFTLLFFDFFKIKTIFGGNASFCLLTLFRI